MRQLIGCVLIAALLCPPIHTSPDNSPGDRPTFKGYLLKVHTAARDVVEPTVREELGRGWALTETGIEYQYRTSNPDTVLSTPDAWDGAHRLRSTGVFDWVEPVFKDSLKPLEAIDSQVEECDSKWPGRIDDSRDADALADSMWSLKPADGANVINAWSAFGSPQTAGAGIYVAHPDTGYRDHPSLHNSVLQWPWKGFDFVRHIDDPEDLAEDGFLQWPGHGTRTANVIAGASDYAIPGGSRHISGVAPGARLMPLRVATRVTLLDVADFDMGNLALAINAAAIGDPNFAPHRADVMSISLGGLPSHSVKDAIAIAKKHRVIVLAAAGNNLPHREVVFPARYPDVIAIAATNARSQKWSGTSRGKDVAFAAPGENVWTASQRRTQGTKFNCVQMSTGTSYAVATAAGVAALWLSKNKSVEIENPAPTFKRLAMETARKTADWDDSLGAGIINAGALLAKPIASVSVNSTRGCADLSDLASFFTNEPESTGFRLLFGNDNRRNCPLIGELGSELATLVLSNDAIGAAIAEYNSTGSFGLTELRQTILTQPISRHLRSYLTIAGTRN